MKTDTKPSRPIVAALRAMVHDRPAVAHASSESPKPFITISRQAGAGAHPLAEALVEAFNADRPEPPWRYYDRELIEHVAGELGLSEALVESLPDRPHSLLEDLAEGMRFDRSRPTDEYIYGNVIATIRALAKLGHAVIVGRGGVYCTQDLRGGVHVQLIAPLASRIRALAAAEGLREVEAAERIQAIERRRDRFYSRFWPDVTERPERFTLTINTETVALDQQVALIGQLLKAGAIAR